MVIIKNYKVKILFNKFPEVSGKIGINFRKFSKGNFELTTLMAGVYKHRHPVFGAYRVF